MQQFKVGDHVIVDGDYGNHNLAAGFDGKVVGVGGCPLVEAYSPRHDRLSWQFVHPSALIKVVDLVTYREAAYDEGDNGRTAALRDAVEVLGADADGAKLVEIAEWLLSGKVPA